MKPATAIAVKPATAVAVEPLTGKAYRLSISTAEEEGADPPREEAERPVLVDLALARAVLAAEQDGRLFVDFEIKVGHREITSSFRGPRGQLLSYQTARRESTLPGSCRVKPGHPVEVAKLGSHSLTLVVTQAEGAPGPGAPGNQGNGVAPDPGKRAAPVRLRRDYRLQLSRDVGDDDPAEVISEVLVSSRTASLPFQAQALPIGGLRGTLKAVLSEEANGTVTLDYEFGASIPFPAGRNVQFLQESTKGTVNVVPGATFRIFRSGRVAWILELSRADTNAENAAPDAAEDPKSLLARHRLVTFGLERAGGDKASAAILTSSPRIVLNPALSLGNAPGDAIPLKLDATIHDLPDRRILMEYTINARVAVSFHPGAVIEFRDTGCRGSVLLNRGEEAAVLRFGDLTFFLQLDGAQHLAEGGVNEEGLPPHLDRNHLVRVACQQNGAVTAEATLLTAATSLELDTFSSEAGGKGQAIPFVVFAKGSLEMKPGGEIGIDYHIELGQIPVVDERGEITLQYKPAKGQALLKPGAAAEVLKAGNRSYLLSIALPERPGENKAARESNLHTIGRPHFVGSGNSGLASLEKDMAESTPEDMNEVTRFLQAAADGQEHASEEVLPLVYQELRRLAAAKMAREQPGQTLQATALVHEAYLRLVGDGRSQKGWDGRTHFLAAAAEAMRRILVEAARRKGRIRHGGKLKRANIDDVHIETGVREDRLLALDEALNELAIEEPLKAEVVKLRYFVGFSNAEVAEALGLSVSTVERYWAFAKAWLFERMQAP